MVAVVACVAPSLRPTSQLPPCLPAVCAQGALRGQLLLVRCTKSVLLGKSQEAHFVLAPKLGSSPGGKNNMKFPPRSLIDQLIQNLEGY